MVEIGSVKSIGKGENYNFDLDDRQELVKTVNGAVAIDPWDGARVSDGDTISFEADFNSSDANTVMGYWGSRTRVTVKLDDGTTINNARVIVRQIKFIDLFVRSHKKLALEIWRV